MSKTVTSEKVVSEAHGTPFTVHHSAPAAPLETSRRKLVTFSKSFANQHFLNYFNNIIICFVGQSMHWPLHTSVSVAQRPSTPVQYISTTSLASRNETESVSKTDTKNEHSEYSLVLADIAPNPRFLFAGHNQYSRCDDTAATNDIRSQPRIWYIYRNSVAVRPRSHFHITVQNLISIPSTNTALLGHYSGRTLTISLYEASTFWFVQYSVTCIATHSSLLFTTIHHCSLPHPYISALCGKQ